MLEELGCRLLRSTIRTFRWNRFSRSGLSLFLAVMVPLMSGLSARSSEVLIAVAANFGETARTLCSRFEELSGQRVVPVLGSTGKLYAQILNGAPFDAFLAADRHRPQLLEEAGRSVSGTRFTYAVGQLVLWVPKASQQVDRSYLEAGNFRHLSMANPKLAPYGEAARQVLSALGLQDRLQPSLVFGENVAQTLHFVESGNAEAGFVAFSQLEGTQRERVGGYWQVPRELYSPIEQQAVLIRDNAAAREFLEYLKSPTARVLIEEAGYLSADQELR